MHRARELTSEPSLGDPMAATAASYSFGAPDPLSPSLRPARPWDMTDPKACEWFDVLGDGLVVVLPPRTPAPGTWTTGGGAWLHVAADGPVTAFTGKVDVGQDNRTALRLLVAEETGTPLSDVRLAMGDTDLCPYDMGTFGSQSMPSAGGALRRVAAHARALMPVAAGARRVEIVGGDAPVVPSTEWLTVGKGHMPAAAVDAVTGWRRFVTDLTLPGLRHAAVLRPPVPGATLRRLDTTAVEGRDDVVVVHTPEVIGVVGIDPTVARLALANLRSEWDVPAAPSEEHLGAYLRSHPAEELDGWGGPFHHEEGDAEGALETAAVRLQATYTTAYIAPAALDTVRPWPSGTVTVASRSGPGLRRRFPCGPKWRPPSASASMRSA